MPKTPKTQPKKQLKTKPKAKQKIQPKPVSITSRKSYWIALTLTMVVFGSFSGYLAKMAVAATGLLLVSVLMLIALAFYLNFYPSDLKATRRATYLFVGASIIGFSIWAAMVLLLNTTGLMQQVVNGVGNSFFAITTLITCLIAGSFIGDLIGKKRESLQLSLTKIKNKIFRLDN